MLGSDLVFQELVAGCPSLVPVGWLGLVLEVLACWLHLIGLQVFWDIGI
jgi:hypothetical protein